MESKGEIVGVLAFYSALTDGFTPHHKANVEALCAALVERYRNKGAVGGASDAQPTPRPSHSRCRGAGRWPVGLVFVQFSAQPDSGAAQQIVWNSLRASVRADDSLTQIETNAYLLIS